MVIALVTVKQTASIYVPDLVMKADGGTVIISMVIVNGGITGRVKDALHEQQVVHIVRLPLLEMVKLLPPRRRPEPRWIVGNSTHFSSAPPLASASGSRKVTLRVVHKYEFLLKHMYARLNKITNQKNIFKIVLGCVLFLKMNLKNRTHHILIQSKVLIEFYVNVLHNYQYV